MKKFLAKSKQGLVPRSFSVVGFTLIELLVAIVIIGIIATLTTLALTSARANARDVRRISDLKQIASALELYYADNNSYPTLITGGNTLVNPNDNSKVYMKKIPSDPSTSTSYAYYGSSSRFTLRTTIEKSVDNIPVGPVIVTSGGVSDKQLTRTTVISIPI